MFTLWLFQGIFFQSHIEPAVYSLSVIQGKYTQTPQLLDLFTFLLIAGEFPDKSGRGFSVYFTVNSLQIPTAAT